MIYIVLLLLVLPLLVVSGICRSLKTVLSNKLKWNSLINLIVESYQIAVVCILINIQVLSMESSGLATMSFICVLFLVFAIVLPSLIITKLAMNGDKLDKKEIRLKFGQMYADLNTKKGARVLV